ncbi:glycosyltransferase family 39 protein [Anaerolineales bacterium HSG24]|nr:glycosyltransferase family 39 protein [Anaerolineales bacterium HSG24]
MFIFILAVIIRGSLLGQFVTVDEPRWVTWSSWFAGGLLWDDYACPTVKSGRQIETHGWGCTLTDSIPGVTTMWLASSGLLAYQQLYTETELRVFLETVEVTPEIVAATQFPFAFVQAGLIVAFYLILAHLLDDRIALIAALIITLQPFHVALSRVIHHDALTTGFMSISFLLMVAYWVYRWSWGWLVLSAMMAGLAILSKPVGWFVLPYAAIVGWWGLFWHHGRDVTKQQIGRLTLQGIAWGLLICLTCLLLFPAFWTIPAEVIRSTLLDSVTNATDGHLQYFMGQVTEQPSGLFYLVGLAFRTTPLEIIGLLVLPFVMWQNRTWLKNPLVWLTILFIGSFLLFVSSPPKKQLRFVLPIFPMLAILVAIGLTGFWDWLAQRWVRLARWPTAPLICMIILWQGWLLEQHAPYYFTYYNPWLGGTPQAAQAITVGWGEGYNEAAAYLNQQPHVETMRVATIGSAPTFRPFFNGDDIGGSSSQKALSADYLVYYINLIQRIAARPEYQPVWHYLQRYHTPEHQIALHGIDYVLIYHNPIQYKIPAEANFLPDQLTFFGYNLTPDGNLTIIWQPSKQGQQLQVNLIPPAKVDIDWILCEPQAQAVDNPTTIIETTCHLAANEGLYRLHVKVDDTPINPFGLGFVSVDALGEFISLSANDAMDQLVTQTLPTSAISLNHPVNEQLRWVGYDITYVDQTMSLYWQITQPPDWALAEQLWLTIQHEQEITTIPWLNESPPSTIALGQILTIKYPWPHGTPPEELCITIGPHASEVMPLHCLGMGIN